MFVEVTAFTIGLYASVKTLRRKKCRPKLASALISIDDESLLRGDESVLIKSLTTFQSEQIDPLLDTLYASGEAFVQKYIALQPTAYPQDSLSSADEPPQTITQAELSINRNLTESVVALTWNTLAAIVYPPLIWISLPFLLKRLIDTLHGAHAEIVQERNVGFATMIAIGTTSLFLLRKFWMFALFDALYMGSEKILFTIRDVSTHNLINIWGEMPRFAWCQQGEVEVAVAIEAIQAGDAVVVHAGEAIPVDGHIVNGFATIDEHMLTGEAQLIEKSVDDRVYAGTILFSGNIVICVAEAGEDTLAGQIGQLLNQTADYRSTLELKGEKLAHASVLPTLALSAVAFGLLGPVSATALISCFVGFQLRYTSPLSILNFLQIATQEGILIKDGRALELISRVDTVVFDKTGTLTLEQLTVGDIHTCAGYTVTEVLRYAASAEYKQTHPIARAILQEAQNCQLALLSLSLMWPMYQGLALMLPFKMEQLLPNRCRWGVSATCNSGRFACPKPFKPRCRPAKSMVLHWFILPLITSWPALSHCIRPSVQKPTRW